jgi:hypothetical protein
MLFECNRHQRGCQRKCVQQVGDSQRFFCAERVRGAAGTYLTHILNLTFTSAYTPEGGQWAKNVGRLCDDGIMLICDVVTYVSNDTSSYGQNSCIYSTRNISRLYPENGDKMFSLLLYLASAKLRSMTLKLSITCIFFTNYVFNL